MKIKSLSYKALGALLALPLIPTLAYAFQMEIATKNNYEGLTPQAHWNEMWSEVMWDITIIGAIYFAIALFFLFRYRRTEHNQVGKSPKLSAQAIIGWVVLPCMLFLGDDLFLFVKAFDLHNQMREVPAHAQTIKVTASMWNWNYDYGNGVDTDNELRVPVGKPVVFRMTSDDVIHSHYLNGYHVTEDVMPGRVTWEWIMPVKVGESVITCREYCGANHSRMYGKLIVMKQANYDAWMVSALADAKAESGHRIASTTVGKAIKNIAASKINKGQEG